jgi:transcriptional regulator with XRE-family HTH domain
MSNISGRLLDLRRSKKLSQNELGKIVGVSREMIGKYERGEVSPSLEIALNIARTLDVSLDYLAGEGQNSKFDTKVLTLIKEIEQLSPDLKDKLLFLANAVIRDAKARQTYA